MGACLQGCAECFRGLLTRKQKDDIISTEWGYPHAPFCKKEYVSRLGTPNPDDVMVCSYPKSGTNWLKQIVHLILIRADANRLQAEEGTDLCDLCPYVEADADLDYAKMPRPRAFHTHLRYEDVPKGGKFIYILRDLPDVAYSLFTFVNAFPNFYEPKPDDYADKILRGVSYAGDYDVHFRSYWDARHDPNVLILKYEDLKADLRGQIIRISGFLGVDLDEQTLQRVMQLSSFDSMKRNEHRIMGSKYLKRITGFDMPEEYSLLHRGKVGNTEKFQAKTLQRVKQYWKNRMQPIVGAPSYAEFRVC
eukprot:CAMPEP_0171063266 /NCGR_PEP_ID=MMETSP0766_2-20121228/5545_1 /TAXON_ID=439317 /ORGANISM="Gambierdiscus australes, Strain CAWD 149" /LENGTH=305 /DNA_ID=CAMNT_0011519139 /DNA_START=70 /DNA_END=987 /DNA_ORIENTATION=-